jgi:hypothetical protein
MSRFVPSTLPLVTTYALLAYSFLLPATLAACHTPLLLSFHVQLLRCTTPSMQASWCPGCLACP